MILIHLNVSTLEVTAFSTKMFFPYVYHTAFSSSISLTCEDKQYLCTIYAYNTEEVGLKQEQNSKYLWTVWMLLSKKRKHE